MATFTASAAHASSGVQPKGLRVGLVAVSAVYSIVNSLSIGSTVQMIKVPAGATPLYVSVGNTNAGQATLSVGDGLNDARYKAHGTTSSGMGMVLANPAAELYTYSTDDTIDVFVSLVSISTLGGALYLRAIYTMDI
jgi:hypothetical protein